ncbi:MAG: 3-isopropylmalate dehydratase small subunit, partial [Gammaproteobacteria bacterium]
MMQKITQVTGKGIPLAMDDVDTDLIIPAQYLTAVTKEGYGENLFRRLREADSNFVFNQEKYIGANILLTKANFGCGSSREHAVWALQEAGIQAIVASSFADIFFSNSAKNGLILIKLPEITIDHMLKLADTGNYHLTIDIEKQQITSSSTEYFEFEMDLFQKYCFLNGLDDLDYLLNQQKK